MGEISSATLATIPCNVTREGEERRIGGAAGTASRKVRCEKTPGDTYEWTGHLNTGGTVAFESAAVDGVSTGIAALYNLGGADPDFYMKGLWNGPTRLGFVVARRYDTAQFSMGDEAPTSAMTVHIEAAHADGISNAIKVHSVALVDNGDSRGINIVARAAASTTGAKILGMEIDIQPSAGAVISNESIGLAINAFNVDMTNCPAIFINGNDGPPAGRFGWGMVINGITQDGVGVTVQAGADEMEMMLSGANGTYGTACAVLGAQNDVPALILRQGLAGTTANILEIQDQSNVDFLTVSGTGVLNVFTNGEQAQFSRYSADANPSVIRMRKSRNATIGGSTIVNSGDALGALIWLGSDGTNYREAARISVEVDGSPTAGGADMPGRIILRTSPDGSATSTARVLIGNDGGLALQDGITAPATRSGWATIYVDSADGDLKVKFGNGFVATLAADS